MSTRIFSSVVAAIRDAASRRSSACGFCMTPRVLLGKQQVAYTQKMAALESASWTSQLGTAHAHAHEAGADLTPTFFDHQVAAAELAGGHIASAARISRALAFTGERQRVTEQDVRTAVAGELQKLGATLEAAKWLTPEGPPLSAPAVSRPHSPRNGAGRVVAGGKR